MRSRRVPKTSRTTWAVLRLSWLSFTFEMATNEKYAGRKEAPEERHEWLLYIRLRWSIDIVRDLQQGSLPIPHIREDN
jgi:hypothetical protein